MTHLFSDLRLRGVVLPNRIGVSPMCQYSCEDGIANDWHSVHLGSRAIGGAGLILTEAAAVVPEGRIAPNDVGVWSEAHFEPWLRINRFIDAHGSIFRHPAGPRRPPRPAPTGRGRAEGTVSLVDGGWRPAGPSPIASATAILRPANSP